MGVSSKDVNPTVQLATAQLVGHRYGSRLHAASQVSTYRLYSPSTAFALTNIAALFEYGASTDSQSSK